MKQDYLNELSVFVEVARQGGFRAAAQKLHMGAGSISESIKRLEDKLNVRLFERTTRKIALTHDGEALYRRSLPAVTDLESAIRDINDNQTEIAGKLRLSAPPSCGPLFLNEFMIEYKALYPNVDLELIYDAHKVDLVTSGIDATIRANSLLEPDTYAVSVGPAVKMMVLASPSYLEEKGMPKEPSNIREHDGICYAFGNADTLAQWKFTNGDGEYSVQPKPKIVVNDLKNLTLYAEAGLGLIYTYASFVEESVQKGSLVKVLESYIAPLPRYTINYLSKRHMPNRLKALIELARTKTYS
ncbi:LysR family transcriptional regulator [Alteromonadaceae bacterium M269]|nr:LysR family transcriptional regulator [Alteromonadaceae bacterium M269]